MTRLTIPITYTKGQFKQAVGQSLSDHAFAFVMSEIHKDVEQYLSSVLFHTSLIDSILHEDIPDDFEHTDTLGSLVHEQENDYELPCGACWITTGPLSVHLKTDQMGTCVSVYARNNETASPLDTAEAEFSEVLDEVG